MPKNHCWRKVGSVNSVKKQSLLQAYIAGSTGPKSKTAGPVVSGQVIVQSAREKELMKQV